DKTPECALPAGLQPALPPPPSLPPPQALPTPAPCVANASVHSISGFSQLPTHVQDFLRYQHCVSFPALLDVPGKCGGPEGSSSTFLLLAIKSSPANYNRREVIRKTWGQERTFQGASIRRLFLVGVEPSGGQAEEKLNRLLRLEQRQSGDILQWGFRDTFFNLTLKQVLFHAWLLRNCPAVRFVFNGDDDVFANTDNLVRFAAGTGGQHLMAGHVIVNTGPIREPRSKYYIPQQLPAPERYPPYCGGGGMLMSGYTARAIARQCQRLRLYPIDDVYLGLCLERAGLKPTAHFGMRTTSLWVPARSSPLDPCYYRELLLVHRFLPYEVALMWDSIHDPQLQCGKKVT
ncbi:B3GN3 acetylglucosaminyltransferase, partial [Tricholaema leucomelas]|nr:B3GN3 acetylglucosaminyltransferase [Tricholaema leucomelas]